MPLEKWATQAGFSHCERGWTGSGASKTEVGPLEAPPGRATWDRAGRGGTSIGPAGPPLDRAQILPLATAFVNGMAAVVAEGWWLLRLERPWLTRSW